ncbi:hypothetical protein KQX54_006369 [Cotesia glomerata]|uniref:Uncharacterized protein n=1 Tax=Cotesia glomerata TaxID=32391 RepID=A0AAV7IUQ6_COTGL|nr:hypothetical protein KQX54_006369 [Cotesia glomerata]
MKSFFVQELKSKIYEYYLKENKRFTEEEEAEEANNYEDYIRGKICDLRRPRTSSKNKNVEKLTFPFISSFIEKDNETQSSSRGSGNGSDSGGGGSGSGNGSCSDDSEEEPSNQKKDNTTPCLKQFNT